MDKWQALQQFWESFGLPAYDEQTVPKDAVMPYITYETAIDSMGYMIPLSASVWYRSTSWEAVSIKAQEIASAIDAREKPLVINGGYAWIVRGEPFARRLNDPEDDLIRRIYMNVAVEYLTAS